MHRFRKKHSVRIWAAGIVVAMTIMAGAMSGSCAFDTTTNFCEQFDLRCKEGQECAVNQAVCINIGGCGNSFMDQGEACDDGNIVDGEMDNNGVFVLDQCNHDCMSTQACGNGIQDKGEECDYGENNGARDDTCDSTCHLVSFVCGNGMIDQNQGEECDPGPMDTATCNSSMAGLLGCKVSRCGDSYINVADKEDCDSGSMDTAECVGTTCKSRLVVIVTSILLPERIARVAAKTRIHAMATARELQAVIWPHVAMAM
jgi:hypothetical protein